METVPPPTPSAPTAPLPEHHPEADPHVAPGGPPGAPLIRKISVVIPVYNEQATIHALVSLVVHATIPRDIPREIVVVNDCSRDGTKEKLDQLPAVFPGVDFKIHHKPVNGGKGAALRDGFELATGDVVIVQDADLEYDPADYPNLLLPILDGKADVVFGSRFTGGGPHRVLYFWHRVANGSLTLLSNMFTNLNLTDMEVGYKVFRKFVLDQINVRCDRFGFEPEIVAKVAMIRPRIRIFEVGISYYGRSYEEGKKITWRDGVKAVLAIVRFGLFDRNL